MATTPGNLTLPASDDDVIINPDDVPAVEEVHIPFIYGGQRYTARTPKDSIFLEMLFGFESTDESSSLSVHMANMWKILAGLTDQATFDDIKNRYLDPDDNDATATRLIKLIELLITEVHEAMDGQLSGLFDRKKTRRKKPADRKPKSTSK